MNTAQLRTLARLAREGNRLAKLQFSLNRVHQSKIDPEHINRVRYLQSVTHGWKVHPSKCTDCKELLEWTQENDKATMEGECDMCGCDLRSLFWRLQGKTTSLVHKTVIEMARGQSL